MNKNKRKIIETICSIIFILNVLQLHAQTSSLNHFTIRIDTETACRNISIRLNDLSNLFKSDIINGKIKIYDTTGATELKIDQYALFYDNLVDTPDILTITETLSEINILKKIQLLENRVIIQSNQDRHKWFSIKREDFDTFIEPTLMSIISANKTNDNTFSLENLYADFWKWLQTFNLELYKYQMELDDSCFNSNNLKEAKNSLKTYVKYTFISTNPLDMTEGYEMQETCPYFPNDTAGKSPIVNLKINIINLKLEPVGIGATKNTSKTDVYSPLYIRPCCLPVKLNNDYEILLYISSLSIINSFKK